MVHALYVFASAAVAWAIALLFIRVPRQAVLYNAIIVGTICAIAEHMLLRAGLDQGFGLLATTLIFVFMTLVVQQQAGGPYGESVLAFFLAKGAESLFRFTERGFVITFGVNIGYCFSLLLISVFIATALALRGNYPQADWRDYFADAVQDVRKLNIRSWHVYFVLGMQCGLLSVCLPLLGATKVGATLAMALAFTAIYWGSIVCVLLMVAYRRETLAVLIEQHYRDEMRSFMNIIRSQRHDYNFHVQTLAGMLNAGDLNACRQYIDKLVKDSIAVNMVLPIKDPAIAALISSFQMLAAREGIELHIDIQDDLSRIVTSAYETNKIISNLLQNAIDEVKLHKDKSYGIWLHILKRGEFCVITVANKLHDHTVVEEYVKNIYKPGRTTKPGHEGIGLSVTKALAERYRGVVYTRIDDRVIHFVAKVPMRYGPEREV